MKLKQYPKYKDSGVQWIGKIPEEWEIRKIKNSCYLNDGNHGEEYPNDFDFTTDSENGVPFIRGGNIDNLTIISKNLLFITKEKNKSMRKGNLQENDVLFMNRGEIGKIGIVSKKFEGANLNSQIAYLRTNPNFLNSKFLTYYLTSNYIQNTINSMKEGSCLTQFTLENIYKLLLIFPKLQEQTKIANFLDKKTQNISQTIEKDKKLIELLKEKRIALINHVVTKGLDKNAKMKESGIDWIGKIPEGWKVKKLKFIARITTGDKNTEDQLPDGKYPFFVRSQTIEKLNTYTFNCEAVLTAGDGVGVGKVFHYYIGKFDVHQRVYVITHFKELLGKYVYYYLKNNLIKEMLKYNAKSTVDSLRLPMFLNFVMTYPKTSNEQLQIVQYLDIQTKKIDQTISKIQEKITLMEEYKKSLIHHVVTGKVDVRTEA